MSNQRKERALKQAYFLKELADVFALLSVDNDFSMTQHLLHILRKKENLTDPYWWDDDQLIRKIAAYKRELRDSLSDEN